MKINGQFYQQYIYIYYIIYKNSARNLRYFYVSFSNLVQRTRTYNLGWQANEKTFIVLRFIAFNGFREGEWRCFSWGIMATFPYEEEKGWQSRRRKKDCEESKKVRTPMISQEIISSFSSIRLFLIFLRVVLENNMVHVLSLTMSLFCLFRSQQFVLSIEIENEELLSQF